MKSLSKYFHAGESPESVKDWKPGDLANEASFSSFEFSELDDELTNNFVLRDDSTGEIDNSEFASMDFPIAQIKNGKAELIDLEKLEPENNRLPSEENDEPEEPNQLTEKLIEERINDAVSKEKLTSRESGTKDRLINKSSQIFNIKSLELEDLFESSFEMDSNNNYMGKKNRSIPEIQTELRQLSELKEVAEREIEGLKQQRDDIQKEAESILFEAQQTAARMVEEAQSLVEQIREKAYTEGVESAKMDAANVISNVEIICNEAALWREQILNQSEPAIVEMIKMIGKKLFGNGFKLDAHGVEEMVARAIAEGSRLGNLRVYLNPHDEELLVTLWQETEVMVNGQKIQLVPSQNILHGGCFIEGEFGTLDSRVESQVELIHREITDTLINKDKENPA